MSEGKSRARERPKQFTATKDRVISVENKSSTAGTDVHQSVSQISACLDKHAAFSGECLGSVIARENFKVMEGVLMQLILKSTGDYVWDGAGGWRHRPVRVDGRRSPTR